MQSSHFDSDLGLALDPAGDSFAELAKLATRNGVGVFLKEVQQVSWTHGVPFAPDADLGSLGGHKIAVFLKPQEAAAGPDKLRQGSAISRCGASMQPVMASLYADLLTTLTDGAGRLSAPSKSRLEWLPKAFLSLAFMAKRVDLITLDIPGSRFKELAIKADDLALKPQLWSDMTELKEMHAHLLQLATIAIKMLPKDEMDEKLEFTELPYPAVPPPPAVSRPIASKNDDRRRAKAGATSRRPAAAAGPAAAEPPAAEPPAAEPPAGVAVADEPPAEELAAAATE